MMVVGPAEPALGRAGWWGAASRIINDYTDDARLATAA
ncbi:MAG: hypothetical protein AVDCRST_MAG76-1199 [uncultured Acidimicrobiales bacterium]|uniref:Uncharacterized protein n=1 Tax=uncultured Acidimicrobiales bacterium TaxID=310071 RepID=A0A6J4HSX9_9ACTN|nr:MAG: hypothetical protein AVDCRST_MAG76-1199 [uncultured Acidimicrobiales bacterium]